MKKRITIEELVSQFPILNSESCAKVVGGGIGTQDNPYTESQAYSLINLGVFAGGYVEDSCGTVSYWLKEVAVTPYGSYSSYGMWGSYGMCGSYGAYGWGQYGSYGNNDTDVNNPEASPWERALAGAGIALGTDAFLADIAQQLCRNDAARQQLYSAAKSSALAGKAAGNIAKGCGAVGLLLSIGGSVQSVTAVVNLDADASDVLNTISIVAGGLGAYLSFTGVGTIPGLICDGVSIGCSIAAELVQ